jgi:hypothetical protein
MTNKIDALVATRKDLHRLAEHVISPSRYAQTGRIGLRPHPGGLRTPAFGDRDTEVSVELDELVIRDARGERRQPVTNIATAAAFVDVVAGAPRQVYEPATECDLDRPLHLDRTAMQTIADWYLLGAEVLRKVSDELADQQPSEAQLWPEHLDLAITVGQVNFGFSPGDAATSEPYAYVGPHAGPPRRDEFWNAPFGAARMRTDASSVEDVLDFFHRAQADLGSALTATEGAMS